MLEGGLTLSCNDIQEHHLNISFLPDLSKELAACAQAVWWHEEGGRHLSASKVRRPRAGTGLHTGLHPGHWSNSS